MSRHQLKGWQYEDAETGILLFLYFRSTFCTKYYIHRRILNNINSYGSSKAKFSELDKLQNLALYLGPLYMSISQ